MLFIEVNTCLNRKFRKKCTSIILIFRENNMFLFLNWCTSAFFEVKKSTFWIREHTNVKAFSTRCSFALQAGFCICVLISAVHRPTSPCPFYSFLLPQFSFSWSELKLGKKLYQYLKLCFFGYHEKNIFVDLGHLYTCLWILFSSLLLGLCFVWIWLIKEKKQCVRLELSSFIFFSWNA